MSKLKFFLDLLRSIVFYKTHEHRTVLHGTVSFESNDSPVAFTLYTIKYHSVLSA